MEAGAIPERHRITSASEIDVQRQRIAALKKEREFLLGELRARSANANELRNRMRQKEISKTQQVKQKIDGTHLGVNLHNTYGPGALDKALDYYNPPTGHTAHFKEQSCLIADLMEHRAKTGQYQEAINLLNNHRRSILAEQQRIHDDKRRLIGGRYSPSVTSIPGDHDVYKYPRPQYPPDTPTEPTRSPYYPYPEEGQVETMDSLVDKVKSLIPKMEKTVSELKHDLDMEDLKFVKLNEEGGKGGLDAFEPYQRDTAIICRSIVNEIVEKSMDSYLRQHLPAHHRKHYEEETLAVSRELQKLQKTTAKQRLCALIRDELVLEVTSELTREAIDEYFEIDRLANAKANNLVIRSAEMSASVEQEERLPDEADYVRVNKLFEKMVRERSEKKTKPETLENLWRHSLPLTHISGKPVLEMREEDVEPIDVHKIRPFSLREKDYESAVYSNFLNREGRYWQNIDVEHAQIVLTPEMKGCQTAKLSSKHRLLAVGTGHGDVLIYDLFQEQPKLLYVAQGPSRKDYPIESVAWSSDDSQLVCQRDRSLTVFNLLISLEVNDRELSDMGLKFRRNESFKPFSLYEVMTLNQNVGDFIFTRGVIADHTEEKTVHSLGKCEFHPESTLAGSNFSVMVSFENGEIQKIDLENDFLGLDPDAEQKKTKLIYPRIEPEHGFNYIGKDVESELFKAHNAPIMLIAFISGIGEMVTLDYEGYLNWWRYTKDHFTQDFCEPYKKNKLTMEKTVYIPVNARDNPPKTIFRRYNLDAKGRRVPIPEDLLEQRIDSAETLLFMKSIEDKEIVWQDNENPDLITRQYPADAISKSGSTFYTVTRTKANYELNKVEKQLLRPQNVRAKRLLEAETTPDGDIIIYMVLFESVEQRGAHISFFAYDLEQKANLDLRLDIPLTDKEYSSILNNNVCSFETTRPFDTISTAYVIVNLMGKLQGYSLTTGTRIMSASDEQFVGLNLLEFTNLPRSILRLPLQTDILVASPPKTDRIQIVAYSPDQSVIDVLSLRDQNTPDVRKSMWLAYKTLYMMQPEHILEYDPDQRIRKFNWLLDGEEYVGAFTACKTVLLDIIDDAVDIAYFEKTTDLEPEPQFDQSGQQIVDEDGNPVLKQAKRGYPSDYEEQKKVQMTKNRQTAIATAGVGNSYGDLKLYADIDEIKTAYERAVRKQERRKAKALANQDGSSQQNENKSTAEGPNVNNGPNTQQAQNAQDTNPEVDDIPPPSPPPPE